MIPAPLIPLIVIRPQPGCDATVAAATATGLEAHGFPLFAIAPVAWEPPPPTSFDALVIGSANALRHAGAGLAAFRGKATYAVGRATADAARVAGLDVIAIGQGGLQRVLDAVCPQHRRLLRLAGRERMHLVPPPGTAMEERVVYASEPLPMPEALVHLLRAGPAVVMLHSAEAARHFAAACDRLGLVRSRIALAAIGPRVAEAAGTGWATLEIPGMPRDDALLALAGRMCQERRER